MDTKIVPAYLAITDDELEVLLEVADMEHMSFNEACQLLISIGHRAYWEKWCPDDWRCSKLVDAGLRVPPHNDDTREQVLKSGVPI